MTAIEAKQLMNQNQISLEKILLGITMMAKSGNNYYTVNQGNISNDILKSLRELGYLVSYDGGYLNVQW